MEHFMVNSMELFSHVLTVDTRLLFSLPHTGNEANTFISIPCFDNTHPHLLYLHAADKRRLSRTSDVAFQLSWPTKLSPSGRCLYCIKW